MAGRWVSLGGGLVQIDIAKVEGIGQCLIFRPLDRPQDVLVTNEIPDAYMPEDRDTIISLGSHESADVLLRQVKSAIDAMRESAGVAPTTGKQISFNLSQARQLLQMFGGEDSDITVEWATGHSGIGQYAHYTELPEEGAELLDPTRAMGDPHRNDALEQAAWRIEACIDGDELKLHAGEMSAQETRTVRAVVKWLATEIRALSDTPSAKPRRDSDG